MSKTGQWVFEMQEDAYDMTLEEFVEKHGETASSIWHEVQEEAGDGRRCLSIRNHSSSLLSTSTEICLRVWYGKNQIRRAMATMLSNFTPRASNVNALALPFAVNVNTLKSLTIESRRP